MFDQAFEFVFLSTRRGDKQRPSIAVSPTRVSARAELPIPASPAWEAGSARNCLLVWETLHWNGVMCKWEWVGVCWESLAGVKNKTSSGE